MTLYVCKDVNNSLVIASSAKLCGATHQIMALFQGVSESPNSRSSGVD